jgi:hypothetical protein
MLAENHIILVYSGPLWSEGLDGLAEMLQRRFDLEDLPMGVSQAVFSVFVEQMNNMMMYSTETVLVSNSDSTQREVAKGVFILGAVDKNYFIQTGNIIKNSSIEQLKSRIDYLNSIDKKEMRQYYKEQMKAENENPESRGAGVGLIEIARRATSKIDYEFTPYSDGLSYFSMYVII